MPVINQNIEIWAGDDVELDIILTEADGETPLDISGTAIVNWALSSAYDIGAILIERSSAVPGEITVAISSGSVIASIFVGDTTDLGGEPYYHEVEVEDGGATVTVMTGSAKINKTALH